MMIGSSLTLFGPPFDFRVLDLQVCGHLLPLRTRAVIDDRWGPFNSKNRTIISNCLRRTTTCLVSSTVIDAGQKKQIKK